MKTNYVAFLILPEWRVIANKFYEENKRNLRAPPDFVKSGIILELAGEFFFKHFDFLTYERHPFDEYGEDGVICCDTCSDPLFVEWKCAAKSTDRYITAKQSILDRARDQKNIIFIGGHHVSDEIRILGYCFYDDFEKKTFARDGERYVSFDKLIDIEKLLRNLR